jgi:hypothetical protein
MTFLITHLTILPKCLISLIHELTSRPLSSDVSGCRDERKFLRSDWPLQYSCQPRNSDLSSVKYNYAAQSYRCVIYQFCPLYEAT